MSAHKTIVPRRVARRARRDAVRQRRRRERRLRSRAASSAFGAHRLRAGTPRGRRRRAVAPRDRRASASASNDRRRRAPSCGVASHAAARALKGPVIGRVWATKVWTRRRRARCSRSIGRVAGASRSPRRLKPRRACAGTWAGHPTALPTSGAPVRALIEPNRRILEPGRGRPRRRVGSSTAIGSRRASVPTTMLASSQRPRASPRGASVRSDHDGGRPPRPNPCAAAARLAAPPSRRDGSVLPSTAAKNSRSETTRGRRSPVRDAHRADGATTGPRRPRDVPVREALEVHITRAPPRRSIVRPSEVRGSVGCARDDPDRLGASSSRGVARDRVGGDPSRTFSRSSRRTCRRRPRAGLPTRRATLPPPGLPAYSIHRLTSPSRPRRTRCARGSPSRAPLRRERGVASEPGAGGVRRRASARRRATCSHCAPPRASSSRTSPTAHAHHPQPQIATPR